MSTENKPVGITKGVGDWDWQNNFVERHMDNASYTSANPANTLVLAGPPRAATITDPNAGGVSSLLAIGALQSINIGGQIPTQPYPSIGTERTFDLQSKPQHTVNLVRMFTNGRNLNRVLYHNLLAQANNSGTSIDVNRFDSAPADSNDATFFGNMDSELYRVPFGLGVLFRSPRHDLLGGLYVEVARITTYNLGVQAGQNFVMEQAMLSCERILTWKNPAGLQNSVPRETLDQILGFAQDAILSSNGTLTETSPK